MTTKDEALKQALDALEYSKSYLDEQEPKGVVYAYRRKGIDDFCTCDERRYKELSEKPNLFETAVFYTAPPKRKPLTDEQIREIADSGVYQVVVFADGTKGIALDKVTVCDFARAAIAKATGENT